MVVRERCWSCGDKNPPDRMVDEKHGEMVICADCHLFQYRGFGALLAMQKNDMIESQKRYDLRHPPRHY